MKEKNGTLLLAPFQSNLAIICKHVMMKNPLKLKQSLLCSTKPNFEFVSTGNESVLATRTRGPAVVPPPQGGTGRSGAERAGRLTASPAAAVTPRPLLPHTLALPLYGHTAPRQAGARRVACVN